MVANGAEGKRMPEVALSFGKPMPWVGMGTATYPIRSSIVREAINIKSAIYRHFDTAANYGTEAALGEATAEAVRAGFGFVAG
uniref:NADP-dependent oxidoreductase domain-containing protein n=1 Tax=Oryza meridionalis TaxID=40149 RepID=A0A0E0EVB0_9ORYZ